MYMKHPSFERLPITKGKGKEKQKRKRTLKGKLCPPKGKGKEKMERKTKTQREEQPKSNVLCKVVNPALVKIPLDL